MCFSDVLSGLYWAKKRKLLPLKVEKDNCDDSYKTRLSAALGERWKERTHAPPPPHHHCPRTVPRSVSLPTQDLRQVSVHEPVCS